MAEFVRRLATTTVRAQRVRRGRALIVAWAALIAVAAAFGFPGRSSIDGRLAGNAVPGSQPTVFSQSNSLLGQPIVTASRLRPGAVVPGMTGSVTVKNTGNQPGIFSLSGVNLVHPAGPNGGDLSQKLQLQVVDTAVTPNVVIYNGALGAMSASNTGSLGTFAPGDSHTYRFSVTFPSSTATTDNRFQDATTSIDFKWDAVSCPALNGNGNAYGTKNC